MRKHGCVLLVAAVACASVAFGPVTLFAQSQEGVAQRAYFNAVAKHFKVSPHEVALLAESRVAPSEVPVVLFLARRGGVSPEAILALRRGGRGWSQLARRYLIGYPALHVPITGSPPLGALEDLHQRVDATPRTEWPQIELTDEEIVWLVNVRMISAVLELPPGRVLVAVPANGSFVSAFRTLARSQR